MTIIKQIENWFKAAVPNPTDDNRRVQLGCHLEEVSEMMQESYTSPKETLEDIIIDESNGRISVSTLAFDLKNGLFNQVKIRDKTAFADALADQIVTAVGLAYMHGIDLEGALNEVNRSNWSKFVNGKPVFDENGKIKKGDGYTPPDLSKFVGE